MLLKYLACVIYDTGLSSTVLNESYRLEVRFVQNQPSGRLTTSKIASNDRNPSVYPFMFDCIALYAISAECSDPKNQSDAS